MKLYRYSIRFKALNGGRLPSFLGNIIRGAMGQAMHDTQPELYRILYEKKGLDKHSAPIEHLPSPYAIYAHNKPGGKINKEDRISFILTLFGEYHHYISSMIPIFEKMASTGLMYGKIKLSFEGIQNLPSLLTGREALELQDFYKADYDKKLMQIKFQSPVILDFKANFSFERMLKALVRRYELLNHYFGDATPLCYPDDLNRVELYKIQLRKIILGRAHIEGFNYNIIAWLGNIEYYDKKCFKDIYPLWMFGQYLQIGERTSAGFGKYRLL